SARLCDVCSLPYRQRGLLLECLSLRRFHTPCSDESLSFGGNPSIQSFARTHEPLQYPFRTVTLAFEYGKSLVARSCSVSNRGTSGTFFARGRFNFARPWFGCHCWRAVSPLESIFISEHDKDPRGSQEHEDLSQRPFDIFSRQLSDLISERSPLTLAIQVLSRK